MAYYTAGTCTTAATLLSSISTFLTSNGWTVDIITSTRLHVHKAAVHIEFWMSGNSLYTMACTGYDSGLSSALQPGGAGSLTYVQLSFQSTTLSFVFVSTANAFYMALQHYGGYAYRALLGFGTVVDKFGSWTGGLFFAAGSMGSQQNASLFEPDRDVFRLFINDAWTPLSTAASGAMGGLNVLTALRTKQPNAYNAGILPQPVFMFKRNSSNASLFHPVGYFPDVMAFSGGAVYVEGEQLTINGVAWVATAMNPFATAVPYLLFKVGA